MSDDLRSVLHNPPESLVGEVFAASIVVSLLLLATSLWLIFRKRP